MAIIGGALFVFIIICLAGSLVGGACTTYTDRKEGQRYFEEGARNRDAMWYKQAKQNDIYYKPNPHAIIPPNECFYSDGSVKYDSTTGRSYEKGQYYCQSDGSTADLRKAPSNVKRPPRS